MKMGTRSFRRLLQALLLLSATAFAVTAHAVVQFRAAESAISSASNGSVVVTGHGSLVSPNSGNATPPLPAHAAGDLLICLAESRDDRTHSTTTSGWARLYMLNGGNDHRASMFYKFATSASEANMTITHSGGNQILARCSGFRGVDPAALISYAEQGQNNTNNVRTGTLNSVQAGATLLFAAHYNQDRALSLPAGWTDGYRSRTSNAGLGLMHRVWPSAGSAGWFQANLDGAARSHGVLIELRPAPAAGSLLTINKPAGTSANDVLIAAVAVAPNTSITVPPGWTLIADTQQTATNPSRTATYYRVATASEPTSYTWMLGSSAGVTAVGSIAAFSGADTSNPIDAWAATATASALTHTAPSVTTTQNGGMLVTVHALASSTAWSTPAGMTSAASIASLAIPDANGVSLAMNYESRANAGSTGPRTATVSADGDAGASHAIALKAAPFSAPVDHYSIDTGGAYGSNCVPQAILITALDASGNTLTSYIGTVSLTTSTNIGEWSIAAGSGALDNGASNDGAASYTFAAGDNGVATLNLLHASQGTVFISVVDAVLGASLSTTATAIQFDNDSYVVTMTDALGALPVAGRPHQIQIERRNNCGTSNTSGNVSLALWLTANASHPAGALAPSVQHVAGTTTLPFAEPGGDNVTLSFTAGIATFLLTSTDVGKYVVDVREGTSGNIRRGSSPTLTVRPWLRLAVPGNPGGAGPNDALFGSVAPVNSVITAGSDFSGTVQAVLWQSADDPGNDGIADAVADLTNNAFTPSYRWDTALSAVAPITPAGGVTGVLNNGSVAASGFAGGVATVNTLQYTEVGSLTIKAEAVDYLNTAGLTLTTTLGPIGRFRPHDFAVSYNTPKFTSYCGSGAGFTYVGQDFTYETAPVLSVMARNALGGTTQNYTAPGGWLKLDTADLSGKTYTAQTGTLDTGLIAPGSDPVVANSGAGVATLTFSDGGGIRFARVDPLAPFDAEISLAINVQDDEGVAFAGNPARFGAPTAGSGIAFTQGKQMLFGRLRILNALGSERLPLPITMRLEHWSGSAFVTNTIDSCTALPRATVAMDNYQSNLNACETALSAATIGFVNGIATPTLAAPGADNNGSVDLRATLSAPPASGPFRNYCNATTLTAVGTGVQTHLRGRWNNAADGDGDPATQYDDDPAARASFGIYGAQKSRRFIYSRENY